MSGDTVVLLNDFARQAVDAFGRACWQGGLFVLGVWIVCRLLPRLPAAIPLPLLPHEAHILREQVPVSWEPFAVQGKM